MPVGKLREQTNSSPDLKPRKQLTDQRTLLLSAGRTCLSALTGRFASGVNVLIAAIVRIDALGATDAAAREL